MSDPYCNFYIGQKIVYEPTQPRGYEQLRRFLNNGSLWAIPVPGQAYHVRELFMDTRLLRVGVRLVELVNPRVQFADGLKEPGWWHCDFQPLTDISELEKLLVSKPIKQLEPV